MRVHGKALPVMVAHAVTLRGKAAAPGPPPPPPRPRAALLTIINMIAIIRR